MFWYIFLHCSTINILDFVPLSFFIKQLFILLTFTPLLPSPPLPSPPLSVSGCGCLLCDVPGEWKVLGPHSYLLSSLHSYEISQLCIVVNPELFSESGTLKKLELDPDKSFQIHTTLNH